MTSLDLEFVRAQFPAFAASALRGWRFFENAGGSYACRHTIDSLQRYYTETKVQPYGFYPASAAAGEAMDRSRQLWAEALTIEPDELHFGPSTSMNTYVLAHAFADLMGPGDEVVVTNQDHEANSGAIRRAARARGANTLEWEVDPERGLLDPEGLGRLLSSRTRVVSFPHASNIVGQENDVQLLTAMAHEVGARVIVDGVSYAPHGIPNLADLNPDVYLLSLYKTYSVHQGLMAVRNGLVDELPNQGHYFNAALPGKRLTPAGPDHAQEAAAGAVLDYIAELAAHHNGSGSSLREAVDLVNGLWQAHETALLTSLLESLRSLPDVRILGPDRVASGGLHRCPTVALVPGSKDPAAVARALAERGIMAGAGHFYARRLVEALGISGDRGVVRLSLVHYTSEEDVAALVEALEQVLA